MHGDAHVQAPLGGELQLVDLTQAPLLNAQENVKKNELDITAALDQLHKEYQSVKTLLDRYLYKSTCIFVCDRVYAVCLLCICVDIELYMCVVLYPCTRF